MKSGLTLTQLAQELDRQQKAKHDVLVDTRQLTALASCESETPLVELHLPDGHGEFAVSGVAHRQLGDYCKIPARFYDMLRNGDPSLKPALEPQPQLLTANLNRLLRERPANRMVRCFNFEDTGSRIARAFLSDRYLRRDNQDVAEAALKVLQEIPDVQVPSMQLTDKHMYITALAPRVQGEVKEGDVVQAGLRIRNSEVGWGALVVEPIIYRLWCKNGCGTWEKTRIFHLGSQIDSDETLRVLSDETLAKDDEAFFAKLADVMRAAVDETKFNDFLVQMRMATETAEMKKPEKSLEVLGKKLSFSEGEQESMLGHLIKGGDLTAYGALNCVTRFAQDVESYERSMELEEAGGAILRMATTKEWESVALAGVA